MRLAARTAVLVGIASLYASPAWANKLIAVLPLDVSHAKRLDPDAQASLEEMLRDVATTALSDDGWTVLATQNMLQTLRDNGVDPSKCGEEECQVTTARELKADKFISGAVQWVEGEYTASIRLIDTATGRILTSARLEGESVKALRRAFEQQAQDFFSRGQLRQRAESAPPPAKTEAPAVPPPPPAAPVAQPTPAAAPAPAPLKSTWLRIGLAVSPLRVPNTDPGTNHFLGSVGLFADWRPLPFLGVAATGASSVTAGLNGMAWGGELAVRGYVFTDLYVAGQFGYFTGTSKENDILNRAFTATWQTITGGVGYVFRWGLFSLGIEARGGYGFARLNGPVAAAGGRSEDGPIFGGSLMPAVVF